MESDTDILRAQISAFLADSGMSPSYFGKLSVGNSELVARLYGGGTVTLDTAQAVRKFMKSEMTATRSRRSPRQPVEPRTV